MGKWDGLCICATIAQGEWVGEKKPFRGIVDKRLSDAITRARSIAARIAAQLLTIDKSGGVK